MEKKEEPWIKVSLSFEEKGTVAAYCKERGQKVQEFGRLAILEKVAKEYRPKRGRPVSPYVFPGITILGSPED